MRLFFTPLLCAVALAGVIAFCAPARSQVMGGITPTEPGPPAEPAPDSEHMHALIADLSNATRWSGAVTELAREGKEAASAVPALEDLMSRLTDPSDRYEVIKALRAIAGPDQPTAAEAYAQIKRDNDMIDAALNGDQKAVAKAIDNGTSVNVRYLDFDAVFDYGKSGYTALMAAVLNGNHDLVKYLLAKGANVNATRRGKTALTIAVLAGEGVDRTKAQEADDQELIKLLQAAGANGDPQHIRLVHQMMLAACMGYEAKADDHPLPPGVPGDLKRAEPIATILARGGNVNWPDEEGFTPLMYAANLGMVKNVKTLLDAGADPTVALPNGIGALVLADAGAKSGREGCSAAADLLRAKMPKKP